MRALLAAAVALGVASPSAAQALFETDAPLRLTISGPLDAIVRDRGSSPQAATLSVAGGAPLAVRLSPRGITRRGKDTCQFPPLRVDFDANQPPGSAFAGQKHLKLVTHCRSDAGFQQKILLEYAAYRIFSALTPLSFGARLAQIDYIGANGRPLVSRVGFFIEDFDDVARRNGLTRAAVGQRIAAGQLSPRDAARFAVFQYLISNYDWAMTAAPAGEACCHNARLLATSGAGGFIPVPYDFDYSGLVDAPYALAPEIVPIENVRQRRYRGYCRHNSEALAASAELRGKQGAVMAAVAQVPGLDQRTARKAADYLSGFFADIANDQMVRAKLLKTCL